MTNILIVGIGGVGGYFGGLLCHAFKEHPTIQIHFLSRGTNLKIIESSGLEITSKDGHLIAHPASITDNPATLGPTVDYVMLCTKSYDLQATLQSLKPCINDRTVFLPLLNGVDSRSRIHDLFPDNLVTDGCANVVSRLVSPGKIERYSDFQKVHFGLQHRHDERLDRLLKILKEANIDATLTIDIEKAIWSKFIFISSAAAVTTYFNATFDQIADNPDYYGYLSEAIDEIITLAKNKNIDLSSRIKEDTLQMFRGAPEGSTTSMHSDFTNQKEKKGKAKTELDSLVGYVIREANKYKIATPTYAKIFESLVSQEEYMGDMDSAPGTSSRKPSR
ncbi:MAG: ketopantoate reductase family protein [Sphingobacterium sp.]